ncbi:hypothetical protein [Paraburkholderia sp. GAS32]|uniref:hypothetical protein n=1 Tax=Paraburkholderia sp. GAS32 TaxID=3035129 RepID=UPI003D242830
MRLHYEITEDEQEAIASEAVDILRRKFKWEICSCCRGSGVVDHPAFSNGITSSEWADMSLDEQGNYMRGDYDVQCDPCKGSGKVKVADVSLMTFGEKRVMARHRQVLRVESELSRQFAAEVAAERRMGC